MDENENFKNFSFTWMGGLEWGFSTASLAGKTIIGKGEYAGKYVIFFNSADLDKQPVTKDLSNGTMGGYVAMHEIGHVLGLKHIDETNNFTGDVIMPIVGKLVGGLDFSNMFIKLADAPAGTADTYAALKAAGVPILAYGNFITVALNFIILAFVIFMMVKQMNRLKKAEPPPPPAPTPEDVVLLREIRDALRK